MHPPYRPAFGRGRGRPRLDATVMQPSLPPVALTPIERRALDFSDLSQWMARMDQAIRHARHTLPAVHSQTSQPNRCRHRWNPLSTLPIAAIENDHRAKPSERDL